MKRVLFAVILLLGIGLFSSCEKEGGTISKSWLAGSWVFTDEADIDCYWTLTKDGKFTYYELSFGAASFSGGTLTNYNYSASMGGFSVERTSKWEVADQGIYAVNDNSITFSMTIPIIIQVTKLGKDSAMITYDGIDSKKVERVKSFKTETQEQEFSL